MKTPELKIESASVKVMRSFDYCHFEVCLTSTFHGLENEIAATDELRKTAARLADKAVEQYKIAKAAAVKREETQQSRHWAALEAKRIELIAEPDRTVREQATLKAFKDEVWEASREYDYQDDWEND